MARHRRSPQLRPVHQQVDPVIPVTTHRPCPTSLPLHLHLPVNTARIHCPNRMFPLLADFIPPPPPPGPVSLHLRRPQSATRPFPLASSDVRYSSATSRHARAATGFDDNQEEDRNEVQTAKSQLDIAETGTSPWHGLQ